MGELRADLRAVHNDIDQLNHALDTSRKQQRDLYADLDQRLKVLEARSGVVASGAGGLVRGGGRRGAVGAAVRLLGAAAAAGAAGGAAGAAARRRRPAPIRPPTRRRSVCLKDSQFDQAIAAFQQFLTTYPDSSLADNAQYWLGEAYYVNKSFPEALAAFPARRHQVSAIAQGSRRPFEGRLLRLRAQTVSGGA